MDFKGDSVNLGDDDIVKNTQFSSDDCVGSQVLASVEAHVLYGSSQENATYSHSPYIPFGGMEPPPMQYPQISYSQQHAWPNYGPGYGSGVHPMHHLVGSGMYSPLSNGNFSGMSQSYSGHTQGGPPDSFLFSQGRHIGGVHPNMEWQNQRPIGPTMQEYYRRAPSFIGSRKNAEPRPLSTREPASSGGPWYCPRPRVEDEDQREDVIAKEKVTSSAAVGTSGNNKMRTHIQGKPPQSSELRHSPPPESAEIQQGPICSNSLGVEKTPATSKYGVGNLNEGTPSQCTGGTQRSIDTPSKSNTPQSLIQRKALREDEKRYLKEVKMAIAEGRVPQVTVVQDENGNTVRYKSQFLNALKLAAHAVVQDAYINVTDQETMNEIMEEVGRQFVVPEPLPAGMVESYLKGYFKRCRSEYHRLWIKNGDKKKPDGCKQAAWLQLIDYWKSGEGKKECSKVKDNATADEYKLGKKLQSPTEWLGEKVGIVDGKADRSGVEKMEKSDSLAFDSENHLSRASAVIKEPRHAMTDISNELHKAVDTIMSSFEARCVSLQSLTFQKEQQRATANVMESEGLRSIKAVSQTTAEVLSSLRRPTTIERENEVSRSCVPNPDMLRRISEKQKLGEGNRGAEDGMKEMPANFDKMASVNDSEPRVQCVFRKGKAEVRQNERTVSISKEVTVLLSSDGSSDGVDFSLQAGETSRRIEDITSISKAVYTKEIKGWKGQSTELGSSLKISGKCLNVEFQNQNEMRPVQKLTKEHLKEKSVMEDQNGSGSRVKQGRSRGNSSNDAGFSVHEGDQDFEAQLECRSEDEMQELDANEQDEDSESEKEEPPVLQREVVKRKLDSQYGGTTMNKEAKGRSNRKSSGPTVKKQKIIQIDASVLKKLQFFKRPKNSNPIKTRTRVWVLHPKFPGKVVAEANAGVNRKSRCVDSANELCKEGQQMISVVRVLYKNTPVMYDLNSRFPKQVSYLDQAEGVPNMPILWCVCHLIEIPPIDQITRLLGEFIQPLSQDIDNSDFELKESTRKGEKNSKAGVEKDNKKGRKQNAGSNAAQSSKVGRTVLRSANV